MRCGLVEKPLLSADIAMDYVRNLSLDAKELLSEIVILGVGQVWAISSETSWQPKFQQLIKNTCKKKLVHLCTRHLTSLAFASHSTCALVHLCTTHLTSLA